MNDWTVSLRQYQQRFVFQAQEDLELREAGFMRIALTIYYLRFRKHAPRWVRKSSSGECWIYKEAWLLFLTHPEGPGASAPIQAKFLRRFAQADEAERKAIEMEAIFHQRKQASHG